jgi:S-adenosylmethionine synthetase
MGRKAEKITKEFTSADGKNISVEVELFPWEKLDYVDKIKAGF